MWITAINVDALTSGEPLPTVAAAALIAFFAWIWLRPVPSFSLEGVTADELRVRTRRDLAWWAFWALVATTVVTWASVQNGFRARSLIIVAIPLLPALFNVWTYAKADAIVARVAARKASIADRGSDAP